MLDSMNFDIPPASTVVVDRKQGVRAFPTSASSLQIGGTRTCRIRLGGNDWVHPDSVRLQFVVNNLSATKPLKPACGPWGVWGQVRLLSGGNELDNLPIYARFHELHGWRLLTQEQQYAEAVYGWGGSWTATGDKPGHPNQGSIPAGGALTVSHKLNLSLFTSGRMLALRYAPLELELSLSSSENWCFTGDVYPDNSTTFSVSDIQLYYDASVIDPSVDEEFARSLMANKSMAIPTQCFYQVVQSIPAGSTSHDFSIVRAFSKLSHVWVTFKTAAGRVSNEFVMPTQQTDVGDFKISVCKDQSPSIRLSLEPKSWPDFQPVTTLTEHFWMLQKSLAGVPMLDRADFSNNTFVSVFDLRRTPGDASSAMSTRSGDLLRISLKNLTPDYATEVHVTLWAYSVCNIRESGVQILD